MTEKTPHNHEKDTHVAKETKANAVKTPEVKSSETKKGAHEKTEKKGCMDYCMSNPGFPWMVIAILFTLLVIMFWREHYYGYGMWHTRPNGIHRNGGMMDDSYGRMRDGGMRYNQQKMESTSNIPQTPVVTPTP